MRKRNWKKMRPKSLLEAFELCGEAALDLHRRPAKQMAEFMDVPLSTYYRWISEASMPAGRIRQFEALCGVNFVSDYLSLAAGRMVIEIPVGRLPSDFDIASLNKIAAEAISLLVDFTTGRATADETLEAQDAALRGFAFHRANVAKVATPELNLAGGE